MKQGPLTNLGDWGPHRIDCGLRFRGAALAPHRLGCGPCGRVAGRDIAGKLSGTERECMRAGRPRSRVGRFQSLLLLKGACAGLPVLSPADAAEPSRLVALRRPS